jgi:hypothetical protein
MLHDPARHEPVLPIAWNEAAARDTIAGIVRETEQAWSPGRWWPVHPRDLAQGDDPDQPATPLYHGACGVVWGLAYLEAVGAARLTRRTGFDELDELLARNRAWLKADGSGDESASFLMGDTPIEMLAQALQPTAERADRIAALIGSNLRHPARELMWGSPGTLLAALAMHERDGDPRWQRLFADTAAQLWSELRWSSGHECFHWVQDLYGRRTAYLDAIHGFVATALPLIRGRALLDPQDWAAWQRCLVNTIQRTATRDGDGVNWRVFLDPPAGSRSGFLMQFCHGAPGFVICLADMPGPELDELLIAAGQAIWSAGPLVKGANLCHGTGGNGYAFLKLYRRFNDPLWLDRARAFAMHGIAQVDADRARFGCGHASLWTGDIGFAIYLWDCLRGDAAFPTLDRFFA